MKIERTMSLADAAVVEVQKRIRGLRAKREAEVVLYSYKNGRENGYTLARFFSEFSLHRAVTFAENRNSDEIVLYTWPDGRYLIDARYDSALSEDAYKNAEYVRGAEQAALQIVQHLFAQS